MRFARWWQSLRSLRLRLGAGAQTVLLTSDNSSWVWPGAYDFNNVQDCILEHGQDFANLIEVMSLSPDDLRNILISLVLRAELQRSIYSAVRSAETTSRQQLLAELAALSDGELTAKLGCNKYSPPSPWIVPATRAALQIKLLLCPHECSPTEYDTCGCQNSRILEPADARRALRDLARGGGHEAFHQPTAVPTAPPTPVTSVGTVFAPLRAVGYHRVAAQDVTVEWPRTVVSQHYRLILNGSSSAFWATTWRFFTDVQCTEPIYPEDARDSGHDGCCATGCIDGVGVGACCCDHFLRSRACGAGECWVEVDFGAAVGVGCMQYSMSGSNDASDALKLQIWRAVKEE